jgi:outer membrane protein assembly factor BamB
VFVTTAVPLAETKLVFFAGPEANSTAGSSNRSTTDTVPHSWRVYALDKQSGKILWQRVAHEGVPQTARHVNQSQANATPATDGKHVVAFFGSEGLYCYDFEGKLLWKRDLGPLHSAYLVDPSYQWNTASSPIIHKNLIILQVDLLENSFMAALDISTGKDVWRVSRDEVPGWATPLIYEGPTGTELVTLAPNYARGYDPDTGKELWRLGKHSTYATPAPIAGLGMVFMTSGSGNSVQPIYALRPGARGDITLGDDEMANDHVLWSKHRGGSFLATPILYDDLLYVATDTGILSAYKAETGERKYQVRLPLAGGSNNYTSSPVAADGKIYFPNADGDVVVVKAGPTFEQLALNPMGEVILASPAIAQDTIIFRSQHHVIAVAESAGRKVSSK